MTGGKETQAMVRGKKEKPIKPFQIQRERYVYILRRTKRERERERESEMGIDICVHPCICCAVEGLWGCVQWRDCDVVMCCSPW